jgi:FkbM family methyltransferase
MLPEKPISAINRLARFLRPVLPHGVLASLAQWLTRYPHEADFKVFDHLSNTRALVLDVGASRGQSALSVLRRTRHIRVVSFEPNQKHRWSLLTILLLHPIRFRFRLLAAGDMPGQATLYIPGKRASGLSAQSSLDPAEFEKEYVRERLARDGFDASDQSAFRRLDVPVLPLDELKLEADMIKLDVEGYEAQALKGLHHTLRKRYPVLLIEVNNKQRWLPVLEEIGYAFYHYDPVAGLLEPASQPGEKLNLFCIHPASATIVSRILLQNVKNR